MVKMPAGNIFAYLRKVPFLQRVADATLNSRHRSDVGSETASDVSFAVNTEEA